MKIIDLKPGDTITTENGASHKITRITPGFYRHSLLIEWRGGWSCQPKSAEIMGPQTPLEALAEETEKLGLY